MSDSRRRVIAAVVAAATIAAAAMTRAAQGQAQQQAPSPAANPQQTDQSNQQPDRPETPTFRAGVNYVGVDVIVTDKRGKPVDHLRPEEFEVTEAGKPQAIETFKVVTLDGGLMAAGDARPRAIRSDADEAREAARDDVRLFAVFLDDYHVKRASSIKVREQLARFVETQLGPSDMVGLMYPLEAIAAVRMTRNRDALRRGLLQFNGRKHDYQPLNEAEARYVGRVPAEQIERMRNEVSFAAIRSLIMRLGGLKEGRKTLILVSEGYSNTLPPQLSAYYGGLGAVGAGDTPKGSFPPVGGLAVPVGQELFASMSIHLDLQDIYNLANRNNVAIYTVDPRGLAASEFGMDLPTVDRATDRKYLNMTSETLEVLAENSDGRAILNRNDTTMAMKQIVVDSSAYYLIGYNSNVAASDGRFHEISVKVKRPGVQTRHRRGYWALKPGEAARMETPAPVRAPGPVEAALAATAVPRSRIIRTWIGAERGENGKTRVTFVWEPMPALAGEPGRESNQPVQIAMTATGSDGESYFRARVPEAATSTPDQSAGARITFEAPPGTMKLRLSIEGADAEVLDSELRDVVVPDLTPPRTLFGTPEVYRARTVPELQRLKSEPRPVPTVAREFSRTERLLLRVPLYGPSGVTPTLTARLLNRAGQTISALAVAPPDLNGSSPRLEVSLAILPAGEYGIALTATGEGGEASEIVAFRVK